MKRYFAEIVLLLCTLILCFVAVRAFSQEKEKAEAPVTLKTGDEVSASEIEGERLGKWKAQIEKLDAQATVLQQQYTSISNERRAVQTKIDDLVKQIKTRIKTERGVEILYDPAAGENGSFHVTASPAPTKK